MKIQQKSPPQLADDCNVWRWGFTPAEIWNGHLAMLLFCVAVSDSWKFSSGQLSSSASCS